MKRLVNERFDDGSLFQIYWDGERTLYVREASLEFERIIEVFLLPRQKVQEIYWKDASVEDGEYPDFIED